MASEPASRNHFFIGGAWVAPSSDRRFQLIDASTEEALGSVPEGVEADIDRGVAAARKAFDDRHGWASWAPFERAEAMARFSEALKKRNAELAKAVSRQNGMPIGLSTTFEGGFSIGVLDYYTQLAEALPEDEVRPSQMGHKTVVSRAPIGRCDGVDVDVAGGGQCHGYRHPGRSDGLGRTSRARGRLYRQGQGRGQAGRRRRPPRGPGPRLVRAAHGVRRRVQQHDHRPRGNLRPGALGDSLSRRGRCRAHRQRLRVRARRLGLGHGRGACAPAGGPRADRHHRHQRLRPLDRLAFRRHQGQRPGSRAGAGSAGHGPADEVDVRDGRSAD